MALTRSVGMPAWTLRVLQQIQPINPKEKNHATTTPNTNRLKHTPVRHHHRRQQQSDLNPKRTFHLPSR